LRNLAATPRATLDGVVYVSGSNSVEEAVQLFACIDLKGEAAKIHARC
jgi:hypothetical protein